MGGVARNDLNYYKKKIEHCYQTLRGSCISKISKHKSLHKSSALNQIVHHMQECD